MAGKRKGIKHTDHGDDETTRSGLFYEAVRIIKEMRSNERSLGRTGESVRPRYSIYENVPGALSSNQGEDWRCVLEAICRVKDPSADVPRPESGKWSTCGSIVGDGYSLAWKITDAQFWGTPQRRRRLALVADYCGYTAADILFDPQYRGETASTESDETESDSGAQPRSEVFSLGSRLPRHSESSGETGQGASTSTAIGAGSASGESRVEPVPIEGNGQRESHRGNGYGNEGDPMFTLNSTEHHAVASSCLNPWDVQSKHIQTPDGVAESLYAGECRYGGGESYVMDGQQTTAYGICSYDSNAMKSSNPNSGVYKTDTSRTLDLNGGSPACNQGGVAVVEEVLPFDTTQVTSPYNGNNPHYGDPCHPLAAGAHPPSVAVTAGFKAGQSKDGGLGYEEEKAPTLSATPSALEPTVLSAGFSFGQSAKARSIGFQEEVSPTLRGGEGGNQKPCVLDATAMSDDVVTMNPRPQSMVCQHDMAETLGADDYKEPQMVFDARGNGDGNTVCTLTGDHQNRVTDYTALVTEPEENPDVNGTLQAKEQGQNLNSNNVVRTAIPTSVVRRLTPTECCALQGFYPDWVEIGEWTDSKGKVHKDADSPKYKALGNSIAVGAANRQSGFWIWLARRICAQYERQITMGSLFSGIGGFELSFVIAGAKPVFASEVESFPIAVCKKHFGDEDAGIEGDVWNYLRR